MSIPSSSAEVDATASRSPSARARSRARRSSGRYPARYAFTRPASAGARPRRVASARISAARRERAKAMARTSSSTSRDRRNEASVIALPLVPLSSSRSGGFHRQNSFSPRGEKLFCLWNPPLLDDESGTRGSAITEASFLLSRLVDDDVRAIAFARSRRAAEILADATRRSLNPALAGRVKAYRAGYLPEERRALERALADGDLLAVASTSALELGIDVGSLDAAILTGYPGTRASMWQQAGRAGRRTESSLAVLVAQDDPLDQYLVSHPTDLFRKPPEAAVIDPTNPYVLGPHLRCAAREQPLDPEELTFFGDAGGEVADDLLAAGELVERRGGGPPPPGGGPHPPRHIPSAAGRRVLLLSG